MFGRRNTTLLSGPSKCGAPCSGAGTLAWRDADATFDAYRTKVARWIDETIFKMGLPRIDHLGRRIRKGAEEARDEEASWGVRRQMRDPGTKLIHAIILEAQAEFFSKVRAGQACILHLRGLMHTIAERSAWRLANKRALELMRETLLAKGEMPSEAAGADTSTSPEEILLDAEKRLTEQTMLSVVDAELLRMSRESAAIFRARTQDPPKSYDEIAEELGIGPGACRKRFSDARARILRLFKPGS